MSDYVRTNNFTAKDALASGNPNKKILGADVDAELEAAKTAIATKLDKTGGTMTGALVLSGAPTIDLHAATKAYVDANANVTKTASASSDLEFTGLLAGCYEFDIDIIFSEEANLVALPGNGSGYASTDCTYYGQQSYYVSAAAAAQYYTTGATGWRIGVGDATRSVAGVLQLAPSPQDTLAKGTWETTYGVTASGIFYHDTGGGHWDEVATKIKFVPSAGTITGTINMRKVS